MAKFKCIHSGTILEFRWDADILEMRKHPEYIEVKEESTKQEVKPVDETPIESTDEVAPVKRGRGRPKKVVAEAA
jgi:hypothetical protein